jgi:dCMP deaminase
MRPSWDEYFLSIANLIQSRSTCLRRQVGAVLVQNNHIISTGYNGAPSGAKHCEEIGCMREQLHVPSGERHELCRAVHAEQNAITQAAFFGASTNGGTMYITHQPCIICAKMMINAGIKKVVYINGYGDETTLNMLKDAGIEIVQIKIEV